MAKKRSKAAKRIARQSLFSGLLRRLVIARKAIDRKIALRA